jgi:hypothetical protein
MRERDLIRFEAIADNPGRVDTSFNAIAVDHIQGVPLACLPVEDVNPVAGRVATDLLTARSARRADESLRPRGDLDHHRRRSPAGLPKMGSFGIACAVGRGPESLLSSRAGPHEIRVVCLIDGVSDAPASRRRGNFAPTKRSRRARSWSSATCVGRRDQP